MLFSCLFIRQKQKRGIRILASRRRSVRLGSDSLAAARSHSGSDSRLRLSFIALVPLRYAAGASFTTEPVRIRLSKGKGGIRILASRRRSVRLGSDSHPRLSFTTEPVRIPCAKRKRALSALFSFWPALGDSNPQPSESESDTLSNCAKGRY